MDKGCQLHHKCKEDEYNRLNEAHLSSRKVTAYPKKIGEQKVAQETDEETDHQDEEDEWTKGCQLHHKCQEDEYNQLHEAHLSSKKATAKRVDDLITPA